MRPLSPSARLPRPVPHGMARDSPKTPSRPSRGWSQHLAPQRPTRLTSHRAGPDESVAQVSPHRSSDSMGGEPTSGRAGRKTLARDM